MSKRDIRRKLLSVLLISLIALILLVHPAEAAAVNENDAPFQIDFIDVGQGDAALVQCDNHYMLIDGGGSKKSSLIYTYLKKRGIRHLDYIVATHADADHIGGLAGALYYASVGTAYCPVTTNDTKTFRNFVKYLNSHGKSITVPSSGENFSLGNSSIAVLGPVRTGDEDNNNSIVLRIVYGNTSFLFTGDAEEEEEKDILSLYPDLQSTVLKVGHHGSKDSTSQYFLRSVAPQYAVISVGDNNSYGHPTEEVLSRLHDTDVITYRTDLQGDVICTSDGNTVSFQVAKNQDINVFIGAGSGQKNADAVSRSMPDQTVTEVQAETSVTRVFVLNTNTKKFHYPECSSVGDIKEKNKKTFNGTRDEAIGQGYVPCKRCCP